MRRDGDGEMEGAAQERLEERSSSQSRLGKARKVG